MRTRVLAGLVFVLSLALYLPSIRNGFAYDDHVVIRLDERVHDLSRIPEILGGTYWQDPDLGLYRPLTSVTYAIDWALSDGNPSWFHAVNTLLNAVACTLLFLVLAQLLPPLAALPAALLFAAHPVHVEAVANVVGRAEVLAGLFSFAAMLVWLRSARGAPLTPPRMAAILGLYLLALLSKESAIMLPALLALADIARRELRPANAADWLRRHAPVLVGLAVAAVAYIIIRTAVTGGLGPHRVDPTLDIANTTPTRILTALQAWPLILRLLFYPRVLLADYGPQILMPALTPNTLAMAGALILGALIVGGLIAWRRGHGIIAAALLFLPVAMLPTSNLIVPIGILLAERTLYLPSFALALAAAWLANRAFATTLPRAAVALPFAIVIALFTARSLQRIPEWDSTTAVHEALLRDRPDAFRAHWYDARRAVEADQPAVALERYARAMTLWPYRDRLTLETAAYAAQVGDADMARRVTEFALTQWPDDVAFLRLHAAALLDRGDTASARGTIARGLRLAPHDSILVRMQHELDR